MPRTYLGYTQDENAADLDQYRQLAINVKAAPYNAVGDGVTDDTAAIQAAIDAAVGEWDVNNSTTYRTKVFIPAGRYRVRQLVIPSNTFLEGVNQVGFGTMFGSRLEQIANCDVDMFRFVGNTSGSWRFAASLGFRNLWLQGNSTMGTTTHCFHFVTEDGLTPVIPQDPCVFENLVIRNFNGDGFRFPNGGVPLHVGPHIFLKANGGAGIRVLRANTGLSLQAFYFDNISGDGNPDGLIYMDGVTGIDTAPITASFVNIKSEATTNATYGSATTANQTDAIVFDGCTDLSVIINGLGASLGPNTTDNIRSAIRIVDTLPRIWFRGVETYYTGSLTGTPVTIRDEVNGVDVPRTVLSGYYGSATREIEVMQGAAGRWVQGRGVVDWPADGNENPGRMLAGPVPTDVLYETDGATDEKTFIRQMASGVHQESLRFDDGTAGSNVRQIYRSGAVLSYTRHLGRQVTGLPNSAPTDANISNSQMSAWVNESTDTLTFRVRKSDGTYLTGTVALS